MTRLHSHHIIEIKLVMALLASVFLTFSALANSAATVGLAVSIGSARVVVARVQGTAGK